MKNLIGCLCALLFLGAGAVCAQNPGEPSDLQRTIDELTAWKRDSKRAEHHRRVWKERARYLNIGYVQQRLTGGAFDGVDPESDFGASFSWGKTFYLHRKPLFGMLEFGLDWSWIDADYAKYSCRFSSVSSAESGASCAIHQLTAGMQFGPSVTLNPVSHLKVNAYFRVAPSYSQLWCGDASEGRYVTCCSVGGAIAWKIVSAGVEWRWGSADYEKIGSGAPAADGKVRTESLRLYIGFRF